MTSVPTLADVVAEHRWYVPSRRDKPWITRCVGCNWKGDTRNTGMNAIGLHSKHVQAEWMKVRTIETVEQLDALPPNTKIVDADTWGWQKDCNEGSRLWIPAAFHSEMLVEDEDCQPSLPALLVWHPGVDQ